MVIYNKRKKAFLVIIIIGLVIFSYLTLQPNFFLKKEKNSPLIENMKIKNFAVYYGSNVNYSVINYLNNFSIVILQPDAFSSNNLSQIKSIKIAYIDLGEFDGSIFPNVTINVSEITIGYDSVWNQTIVNVSSSLWNNYILTLVNKSIREGFNGVMFDDLDVVEQYPWEYKSFVDIISNVSLAFPKAIIGVNRGFMLFPSISKFVNFVLYEDFGSFYNFSSGSYQVLNATQMETAKLRISTIVSDGIEVLGLGYSQEPNDYIFNYDNSLGREYDIPVYVTNITVSSLWPQ